MSIADFSYSSSEALSLNVTSDSEANGAGRQDICYPKAPEPVHRIREVREQQGMSIRSISRRTGVEPRFLREEENPHTDLALSDLLRWQQVLDVPLIDLLEETDEPISRPVMERARLVKLMKTARAMQEKAKDSLNETARQHVVQPIGRADAGTGRGRRLALRRSTPNARRNGSHRRTDHPRRFADR